jgi:hypothetical protein
MQLRIAVCAIALTFGLGAWGGTPELEAATNAALAAERAAIEPAPPSGPAWSSVEQEIQASESRSHQYVTHEYQVLHDNLQALWLGTEPPPIDPPPVEPPPAVTGAIDIGDSGYPAKLTPDFHGHTFNWDSDFWREINRPVTGDAVDLRSAFYMGKLAGLNIHMDFFGTDNSTSPPTLVGPYWGLPVNTVRGDAPRVLVDVPSGYTSESDAPLMIPIPNRPAIEGWLYTAGNQVGGAPNSTPPTFADIENNPGTDHHMFIVQRDEATGGIGALYELSKPWYDGSKWHAKQVSTWGPDGLPRREGWTSTDAAGLPRYPLIPRFDETRRPGGVGHALAATFNVGAVQGRYVWPARHSAQGADGLPFGARLRLTAAWCAANKASFVSDARALVDAMCTYGIINTDIGGNLFLMGVSDARFDHANLMTLQSIPASAFEVCKIVPQFEPIGPTTVKVGVPSKWTLKFNPLHEPNGDHGYYIHAYQQVAGAWTVVPGYNDAQPHMVNYNAADPSFVITPQQVGPMLIEIDQAGEAKLAWTQETQPIPGRGPYPYLSVQVTP